MKHCPHCEARLPSGATACPECGSDRRTGWASDEDLDYEGVEIPDAYDPERWEKEAEERELARPGPRLLAVVFTVFAIVIVIAVAGKLIERAFGR